jgi:hypothetical protein
MDFYQCFDFHFVKCVLNGFRLFIVSNDYRHKPIVFEQLVSKILFENRQNSSLLVGKPKKKHVMKNWLVLE